MSALLALLTLVPLPQATADAQSSRGRGIPVNPVPGGYETAVARAVTVIAQYSRWPGDKRTIRGCVVTPADHAGKLSNGSLSDGRRLVVSRVSVSRVGSSSCDLVYIGRFSMDRQRQLTASLRSKPVLTIAESDPACRSRAMFCLLFQADTLSFRLNMDAVSRSQVKIDPRVLRMGLGG